MTLHRTRAALLIAEGEAETLTRATREGTPQFRALTQLLNAIRRAKVLADSMERETT